MMSDQPDPTPGTPPPHRSAGPKGGRKRRLPLWGRLLGWLSVGLATVLLLVGVALAFIASSAGSRWVLDRVVASTQGPDSPARLHLDGVRGSLLGRLELARLSLSDSQGPWLTGEDLVLEWRPWALLSGKLWIEDLKGRAVTITRAPESGPDDPAGQDPADSAGGFDPLILQRVVLRGFSLGTLTLNEGVIGPQAALTLRAQTRDTSFGGVAALVEAKRLDGATSLVADLSFDNKRSLDVAARFFDERGGLIGQLSGIPGAPAVDLTIEGDGPLDHWQGHMDGSLEGIATLSGELFFGLSQDIEVRGTGRLTPGERLAADLGDLAAQAVGRGIDFRLTAAQFADGAMNLRDLSLSADAWAAQAALRQGADGVLDGRLDAAVSQADLLRALTGTGAEDLSLSVEISGRVDAPSVVADMRANGGFVEAARADLTAPVVAGLGSALGGAPPRDLSLLVEIERWGPDAAAFAPVLGDPVRLTGEGRLDVQGATLDLSRLTVQSAISDLDASGAVSWADGLTASGEVRATADDLNRLSDLTGLALNGQSVLVVTLTDLRQPQGGPLAASGTVTITGDDLAVGIAPADALLGGRLRAESQWAVQGDSLAIPALEVETLGLHLTGGAALGEGGTLRLADLAQPGDDAGRLSGLVALSVLDLSLLDGRATGGVSLPLNLSGTIAVPQLSGVLAGDRLAWQGEALTLTVPLQLSPTQVSIEDLGIGLAGGSLGGNLSVALDGPAGPALTGGFVASVQDPAALRGVIGVTVHRESTLSVELRPENGQTAAITGTIPALDAAGIAVRGVALEGAFHHLFQAPQGRISVTSQAVQSGDAVGFSNLRILADVTADQSVSLQTTGQGTLAQSFDLALKAQVTPSESPLRIRMEQFDLTNDQHKVTLAQPLTVTQTADGWQVAGVRLLLDDGELSGEGGLSSKGIQAALTLRALPLSLADLAVADFPLTGRVAGQVDLAGKTGQLDVTLSDVALPDAEVSGLGGTMRATMQPRQLESTVSVTGFGQQPLTARADLPLIFAANGLPSVPGDQPLSAQVAWQGPVASLWALVPVVGHRLSGDAVLNAEVQGTLNDPRFAGQARITQGRYENLEWGTVLNDMGVQADLSERGAVSVTAEAKDGGQGRMTARVKMTPPDPAEGQAGAGGSAEGRATPTIAALVTLTGAKVVRRDDLKVTLEGDIRFEQQPNADGGMRSALTGALRSKGVEVRITDSLGGGVDTLPVVELNRQAAGLPEKENADGDNGADAGQAIALDLSITLPSQVFVRGQGLESEWKGDLHVGGTSAAPLMTGELSVVRGGFSVVGKSFALNKGVITFAGGERINPGLDILAVHETDELEAAIEVGGTAKRPTLQLSSTPSLPSDEILSRVLFGNSLGNLSPQQAISVAQAAATLSGEGGGLGGGLNIADMMRSSLGLDVLSFGGGGGGAGAVEVGKYVAEGVYVGVEQGLTPESSNVTVEVELTPRVSVDSTTNAVTGTDVGIQYRFDY